MTDLEKALAAGGQVVPEDSDLARALAAGGQRVEDDAGAETPDEAALRESFLTPGPRKQPKPARNVPADRIGRANAEFRAGERGIPRDLRDLSQQEDPLHELGRAASGVGNSMINAATLGGYKAALDLGGEAVPELAQASQDISQYRGEFPVASQFTDIPGAMTGPSSMLARSVGAGLGAVTRAAPPAVANVLASRPVSGAIAGGLGGAGAAAAEETAAGGSGGDILRATGRGALIGAGLGLAGGTVAAGADMVKRKLAEGAPQRILGSISQGEDGLAGATKTAKKMLSRDQADVVNIVTEDPDVARVVSKPAKDALPVLRQKLDQWGAKLDPNYDVIDTATGGASLRDFVQYMDTEAARLRQSPLNEKYVQAVEDIRDSALAAWDPQALGVLRSNPGVPPNLLLQQVNSRVPSKALRQMTTRLQTRGSQVINPLNPGEASKMKADMADLVKGFLDQHLDAAAASPDPRVGEAVATIRDEINPRYSALKNITKAVEQRGDNEATRSRSLVGIGTDMLGKGGAINALISGNPAQAMAIYAGSKVLPPVLNAIGTRADVALARRAMRPPGPITQPTPEMIAIGLGLPVRREEQR